MHRFSIGELARAADVSVDTIRFYEKSGLLPQPFRRPSGVREYSDVDLPQLQFVRRARAVGLSLEEVGQLVSLADEGGAETVSAAIASRLSLLDSKIAQLTRWRDALQTLQSARPRELSRQRLLCAIDGDESADPVRSEPASIHPIFKDSQR